MSDTPFMPLWVPDFVGDTLDLDAKEIGAYMLILMTMWGRDGKLPADQSKLKRVARVGRDWPKVWASISHYFTEENGMIVNKRLSQELLKVNAKRAVNAQSGARGGRAKALKEKEARLANATVSLYQPEPEPDIGNKDTNVSLSVSPDTPAPANNVSEAVARYNKAAQHAGWPQIQKLNPNRSKQLRARLKDCDGLEGWEVALRKAFTSDFCRGRTAKPWTGFGFDWLIKSANFTKLMEGNYDNRSNNPHQNPNVGGSPTSLASIVARRELERRQTPQA